MKIATFNINNVDKRLENLLDWLAASKPDIVCLQELKTAHAMFPERALKDAGYRAAWRGQKTWNGVAILARGAEPVVTRTELPGDPADTQSRYIEAAVNGVLVASVYAPNGNPQPGAKFTYKLAWLARLARHARALQKAGVPAVPIMGQRRAGPAGEPRRIPEAAQAGLDRRVARHPSRHADVHVLALHAEALCTGQRPAA
jgi:exodeoxyribonuclease-3